MTGRRERTHGRAPRAALLLVAPLLALAAVLVPVTAPAVSAASDGLTLATTSTYGLMPSAGVVHVVVDVSARNDKPDLVSGGVRTRYFYDGFRLGIQPEARSVRATSGGRAVAVTEQPSSDFIQLDVRFLRSLFHGESATVRVAFDLPGGAPRSKSEVRVGPAFVSFVAWAFGDSGSVRIVVPKSFSAATSGSDLTETTSGSATVYAATGITDVPDWYAVVDADRPSALTSTRIDLAGGEHLVVHAWPDDPSWAKDVTTLLTDGLPELAIQTGLDWPVSGDLGVFEVHTPLLEGYAGVFFEDENRIEISEDLDDLTILHEASHAWFNGGLFTGRWINEGFADTYAARSLAAMGQGGWQPGAVSPTERAAVKLNDWTFPGRITDQATDAREAFGYDASWTVVRSIVDDVGEAGMQAVLQAAQRGDIAYTGVGTAEHVSGPADWRRLLDLLDERGGAKTADGLFRTWVASDADAKALDARAGAREAYARLGSDAGGWAIPIAVRRPMSDWQFPAAEEQMADAEAVLGQAHDIATVATALGVAPPVDLRSAFEGASQSFDDATRIATAELVAARSVQAAANAVAAPRAPLVTLGLLGTDPAASLQAVLAAFSAGTPTAAADADALTNAIAGATQIGRDRLLIGLAIGAVAVVALLVLAAVFWRRRARRPPSVAAASSVTAPSPIAAAAAQPPPAVASTMDASATLADQSVGPVEDAPRPVEEPPRPPATPGDAP
jgi:hypothetical protein